MRHPDMPANVSKPITTLTVFILRNKVSSPEERHHHVAAPELLPSVALLWPDGGQRLQHAGASRLNNRGYPEVSHRFLQSEVVTANVEVVSSQ